MDTDNTIDIFIDNVPFRLKSYYRSNTDDMVARFGSSEKGDTNLDTLKVATQKSFRGGMFQRVAVDPEMVSSIAGGYYNKLDDSFYFSPKLTISTSATDLGNGGVDSWCWWRGLIYFTGRSANPSSVNFNRLYSYNPDTGVYTDIALPAALSYVTSWRLNITPFDDYLYISFKGTNGSGNNAHRMTTAGVFTDVLGDFLDFFEFRSKMYGIAWHNALMLITSHTTTPMVWSKIKDVGLHDPSVISTYQWTKVFNGAAYMAFTTGLYRFDGVDIDCVIDFKKNASTDNFAFGEVWNGKLFYTIGNKLFTFDGINIDELQNFSQGYRITQLAAGQDRLWINVEIDNNLSMVDKAGNTVPLVEYVVFCWNGTGFFIYKRMPQPTTEAFGDPVIWPIKKKLMWMVPRWYLNGSSEVRSGGLTLATIDLATEFLLESVNNTAKMEITGSEEDAGYPVIAKSLNGVFVDYDGLGSGDYKVIVEAQARFNGAWGAWTTIWDSTALAFGSTPDYRLYEQTKYTDTVPSEQFFDTAPIKYHTIKYRLTVIATTNTPVAPFRLRKLSLRYALQPDLRKQWSLNLSLEPIYNSDGTILFSAGYLRNVINDAISNKQPVLFYDADISTVKSVSPIKLNKFRFVDTGHTIAIRDPSSLVGKWMNRRITQVSASSASDDTTITLDKFGYRKSINGATSGDALLVLGAEVRRSFAVFITSINNERYILDANTTKKINGATDIPSDITITIKEV